MFWNSILRRRAGRAAPSKATFSLSLTDYAKLEQLLALVNDRSQPNINALGNTLRGLNALSLNVKAMGYELARTLAASLPVAEAGPARHVGLLSKLSTQADIESDWFAHWSAALQIPRLYHRKIWELAFVLQALFEHGQLAAGRRGVGFGCGNEPIASYLASLGIHTLITDLPSGDQRSRAWAKTNEHAASIENAFHPHLVDRETFLQFVKYRTVDMNAIPSDLTGFDFCWSICAFEHLGSIAKGLDFVENALKAIRPGGVAIHTTEFNMDAEGETIDNWVTVLFQRKHMISLADRLRAQGHEVVAFDFDYGSKPLDYFIDIPPYMGLSEGNLVEWLGQPSHLKICIDGFVCTCIGLIITKTADAPPA